ncbi:Protein S100-G [Lemmus lemmus]
MSTTKSPEEMKSIFEKYAAKEGDPNQLSKEELKLLIQSEFPSLLKVSAYLSSQRPLPLGAVSFPPTPSRGSTKGGEVGLGGAESCEERHTPGTRRFGPQVTGYCQGTSYIGTRLKWASPSPKGLLDRPGFQALCARSEWLWAERGHQREGDKSIQAPSVLLAGPKWPRGKHGGLGTEARGVSGEAQEGSYLCSGQGAVECGSRSSTQRPAGPGAHLSCGSRDLI